MARGNRQKGYILAFVMIVAFLMSLTVITAFAAAYRYMNFMKRSVGDLREDVYVSASEPDPAAGETPAAEPASEATTDAQP